mgnify:CR=1 FL=1
MIPREHGGWGILLFSIALGVGAAGRVGLPLLLFTLAALALFFARYPLTLMVKGTSKDRAMIWEAIYVTVAILAFLPLLFIYHLWWLVLFGIAFALYLGAYLYLAIAKKQRTVWGEMIGISGLSMAAPMAYYVASGAWQAGVLYLWLLSFLYHASSVFYVKLKVSYKTLPDLALSLARKLQMSRGLLLYLGMLVVAVVALGLGGQVPTLALLAYLPLLAKAIASAFSPSKVASIRVLGWTEVFHALLFTGLMVAVYRIGNS